MDFDSTSFLMDPLPQQIDQSIALDDTEKRTDHDENDGFNLANELQEVVASLRQSNLCPSLARDLSSVVGSTPGGCAENEENGNSIVRVREEHAYDVDEKENTMMRGSIVRRRRDPLRRRREDAVVPTQQKESAIIKLLRDRVDEKERIEQDLLDRLRDAQDQMDADHERSSRARLENERLHRQVTESGFEVKRLRAQIEEAHETERRQKKLVQRLETELESKKSVLAESFKTEQRARDLEAANEDLKKQLVSFKTQLDASRRDAEAANRDRREQERAHAREIVDVQRQVKDLQGKLVKTQSTLQDANAQLASASEERSRLEHDAKETRRSLLEVKESSHNEAQRFERERREMQGEIEAGHERVARAEQAANALVDEVETLRDAKIQLESAMHEKSRESVEATNAIKTWQEQVAMLQEQVGERHTRENRLAKDLRDATSRESALKSELADAKDAETSCRRRAEESRLMVRELEALLETAKSKEGELIRRVQQLESESRLTQGRLSTQADVEVKLRNEITSANAYVLSLKKELDERGRTCATKDDTISSLRQQLLASGKDLQAKDRALLEAEYKCRMMEKDAQDHARALTQTAERRDEHAKEFEAEKIRLTSLVETLEGEMRKQKDECSRKIEEANDAVEAMRANVTEKEDSVRQLVEDVRQSEESRTALQTLTRDLERANASLRQRCTSLETRLALLDEEMERGDRTLNDAKSAVSSQQSRTRQLRAELEAIRQERDNLWKEVDTLRANLRQSQRQPRRRTDSDAEASSITKTVVIEGSKVVSASAITEVRSQLVETLRSLIRLREKGVVLTNMVKDLRGEIASSRTKTGDVSRWTSPRVGPSVRDLLTSGKRSA